MRRRRRNGVRKRRGEKRGEEGEESKERRGQRGFGKCGVDVKRMDEQGIMG